MNEEKEIYYLDRPGVPAVQQNIIDPGVLMEHAVLTFTKDTPNDLTAYATEVKSSDGDVLGTILYIPGLNYETIVTPYGDEALSV